MMLDFAERYAKLAALLGFLFAVFQYYDTGRAARVERSIDYFEIYQDKAQSAKNEIDTMYREYQANVGDLTSQSETDEVFYAVQLNIPCTSRRLPPTWTGCGSACFPVRATKRRRGH